MKRFFLIPLFALLSFGQSKSFYTDQPDLWSNDISLGAGGTSSAPTRTANSQKSYTLFAPTYAASTGRGTFASIYYTDDGTDRSLYLGKLADGLTDFRIYTSTYGAGAGTLRFSISSSGTVQTYSTTVIGGLLRPDADGTRDLGSGAFSWANGWFDGNMTLGSAGNLNFASRSLIESPSNGTLAFRTATSGNMTRLLFGTADGDGPALTVATDSIIATDGLGAKIPFGALSYTIDDRLISYSGASHEAVTTANTGSLGLVSSGGVGRLQVKKTLTGNTGWTNVLDASDLGVSVQAYDADLAAIAALSPSTGQIIVRTNSTWEAMTPGSSGIGGSTGSTDNALLRADGTGGSTAQASVITLSDETAYSSQYYVSLAAAGAQTRNDVNIRPKGTGAFYLGPIADGTGTGGNNRGNYAVDLQMEHIVAGYVASGANSLAAGQLVQASGAQSAAIGSTLIASGAQSFAANYEGSATGIASASINWGGTASGNASLVSGYKASAPRLGERAVASGMTATLGDAQISEFVLRNTTTSTTPTVLYLDGSSDAPDMENNTIWFIDAMVTGSTAAGAAVNCYRFSTVIIRGSNAASTTLKGSTGAATVVFEDDAGADAAITASTSGYPVLTVTAANATSTHWVGAFRVLQVKK